MELLILSSIFHPSSLLSDFHCKFCYRGEGMNNEPRVYQFFLLLVVASLYNFAGVDVKCRGILPF